MTAAAVLTALEYRIRVLVTHNHFDKSTLESAFIEKKYIRHELTDLSDTGIDALSRVIKFNRLEKNEISSYTTTILKNRLDLLIGTRNTNRDMYFSNIKDVIDPILQSANQFYDLIFIDTAVGRNDLTMRILDKSDLIVVNLIQNIHILEDFLSLYAEMAEKVLILLGKYDPNSKFNLKAIRRRFNMANIQIIPYDIGYADACSESRSIDFFLKNLQAVNDDVHYPFISNVRETAETILQRLGVDTVQKKV
jgi:cellulose biosynthesis protein BcsQ